MEPLIDAQGRHITYLRLSVTDRCNFRCTYCSPASWGGRSNLLSPEEFERIVFVFAAMGIRRVRLTGGEPLARPDILDIASRVARVRGIEHLAITTNASRLAALAGPLKEAGVSQLNMSLDTLRPETFRAISSQGDLGEVIHGIETAARVGFDSLKLNAVMMKDVNDHEIRELIAFAHARHITPRFIELMPFGKGQPVPTAELVGRLQSHGFVLNEDEATSEAHSGPARYFRSSTGRIGFISPMTQNFCGGCNRVRVASNGDLRSCLGGREQAPLSQLIRKGATDSELEQSIRRALGEKPEGHRFNEPSARPELLSMMGIGG